MRSEREQAKHDHETAELEHVRKHGKRRLPASPAVTPADLGFGPGPADAEERVEITPFGETYAAALERWPDAEIGEDDEGQLIVYTGVYKK